LEAQLTLKEQEIQFLRKKITQYEKNLDDSKNRFDQKIKAIKREFDDCAKEALQELQQKQELVFSSIGELLPLVEALERSSLHGRHFVPSETNVAILFKMKQITLSLSQEITTDRLIQRSSPSMVSLLFILS
jgi:molecular chaperone GrpE (heat shock protein)